MIDVDSSGDISDAEMKVLLEQMGLVVDDNMLRKLIKTIDLNGNGTIEFDEFCYMMYCIRTQNGSRDKDEDGYGNMAGIWDELEVASNYNEKNEKNTKKVKKSDKKDTSSNTSNNSNLPTINTNGLQLPSIETFSANTTPKKGNNGRASMYNSPTAPPPQHLLNTNTSTPTSTTPTTPTGTGTRRDSLKQKRKLGEALFQLSDGHYMAGQKFGSGIGRSNSSSSGSSTNNTNNMTSGVPMQDLMINRNNSTDSNTNDFIVMNINGSSSNGNGGNGSVGSALDSTNNSPRNNNTNNTNITTGRGKESSLMNSMNNNSVSNSSTNGNNGNNGNNVKPGLNRTSSMNWENKNNNGTGSGSGSGTPNGDSGSFLPSISGPNSPNPNSSPMKTPGKYEDINNSSYNSNSKSNTNSNTNTTNNSNPGTPSNRNNNNNNNNTNRNRLNTCDSNTINEDGEYYPNPNTSNNNGNGDLDLANGENKEDIVDMDVDTSYLGTFASNSAKLRKRFSSNDWNNDNSGNSGNSGPGTLSRSSSMKMLSNVSSRLTSAVAESTSIAKKTMNLVSSKAVEMQRAVTDVIKGDEELYVDEDGETHDKYCFCGCRCD